MHSYIKITKETCKNYQQSEKRPSNKYTYDNMMNLFFWSISLCKLSMCTRQYRYKQFQFWWQVLLRCTLIIYFYTIAGWACGLASWTTVMNFSTSLVSFILFCFLGEWTYIWYVDTYRHIVLLHCYKMKSNYNWHWLSSFYELDQVWHVAFDPFFMTQKKHILEKFLHIISIDWKCVTLFNFILDDQKTWTSNYHKSMFMKTFMFKHCNEYDSWVER